MVDDKSKWPQLKDRNITKATSCDLPLLIASDYTDIYQMKHDVVRKKFQVVFAQNKV